MYVRKKRNHSGRTSVQLIQKINGRYKVYKTIGCATIQQNIEKLVLLANQEIENISAQPKLFKSETDQAVEQTLSTISNGDIQTIGPEIVFGKIYDSIGFLACSSLLPGPSLLEIQLYYYQQLIFISKAYYN